MENSEWLEFGRTSLTSPHLIPGSSFFGYNGAYNALECASGQGMNNIALGWITLTNAVNGLATSMISSVNRERSLIIVIQMIYESIRFARISDLLTATFSNNSSSPLPD
ncbi:ribosome-inactivating protein charybdin-like [Camellia sinensis]|uniref:ribosome-inactivating protein charybdin-like n=1 Tax=Camellia sinensis TaxID=4442 RepID=UPI001036C0BA|nr:ribosome-inactivating protein charybdin-like [Camellia sinensis]XP_028122711.1 ribosome-inactivating protein charybdin-like [Camellia sinensis]